MFHYKKWINIDVIIFDQISGSSLMSLFAGLTNNSKMKIPYMEIQPAQFSWMLIPRELKIDTLRY